MHSFGDPFITLSTVESTNNYAMAQAHARLAKHGTAYFAMEQNKGKGQRGKEWKSEPGANIIMSLVIEPQSISPSQKFLFNAAIALGCYDFFKSHVRSNVSIKWPNDIYWNDRKAGGILIENLFHGEKWLYAIVGIGININQESFPDYLPNPVSLKLITNSRFDVFQLSKDLLRCLEERYLQLLEPNGNKILDSYRSILYRINESCRFKKENIVFDAVVKSVTHDGKLIVDRGMEQEFDFGEVEWILEKD